ncbi:MAG: hypothetical protein ACM31O_14465 [Bacteroidota bacterium]
MAEAIAKSGLFGMKTPEQALALMLTAQAEGQHPATITQDYDIIQGRAARKTHSVLARFQQAGGKVEWQELTDAKARATFSHPAGGALTIEWTIEMARRCDLTGKDNWKKYPRAMLRARCIAEGIRAVFPAAIGGMLVAEEAQDIAPERDVTHEGQTITTTQVQPTALPPYPQDKFDENLPTWRALIEAQKKSATDIIAFISTKYTLTEAQRALIDPPVNATTTETQQ